VLLLGKQFSSHRVARYVMSRELLLLVHSPEILRDTAGLNAISH